MGQLLQALATRGISRIATREHEFVERLSRALYSIVTDRGRSIWWAGKRQIGAAFRLKKAGAAPYNSEILDLGALRPASAN